MAYCTLADMEKLTSPTMLINLSNDQAGALAPNQSNIDEAIDQADREIDAYISLAGYAVPMDPVPPLIANLSAKMAIWNLHLRKYFDSEIWRSTYETCQRILLRIAEGKMTIGQEIEGEQQAAPGRQAVATRPRKFTQSTMEAFNGFSD